MGILIYTLAAICVLLPFFVGQRFGIVKYFSPLHLVSYFALFGIFVKVVSVDLFGTAMFYARYGVHDETVLIGFIYVSVFVSLVCLGYRIGVRKNGVKYYRERSARSLIESVVQIQRPSLIAWLSVFCVLLYLLLIVEARGVGSIWQIASITIIGQLSATKAVAIDNVAGFGNTFAIVALLLVFTKLTMAIYFVRLFVLRRKVDLCWFLVLVVLLLLASVASGRRQALLELFCIVTILSVILAPHFGLKKLVNWSISLFLVVSLFVTMTNLRANRGDLEGVGFSLDGAIEQVVSSTYFLDVNVPILMMAKADPTDTLFGSSYLSWAYGWIPRIVWPEKPAIALGPYVKQEVLGEYGTLGGVNATAAGEAYINFGWFGLLVALLLGLLYRRVEEYFLAVDHESQKSYRVLLYPLVYFGFLSGTISSSFSATFITFVIQAMIILFMLKKLSKGVQV